MSDTARRNQRDEALLAEWAGTTMGQRVTVKRSNGTELRTTILCAPFSLDGRGAYVLVDGITGNTHLRRVTKGWNPASEAIRYKDIQKGLKVRRGGNPRTDVGRLRKAQVFEVAEVHGKPGNGYCRALLHREGEAINVYACALVERWEKA